MFLVTPVVRFFQNVYLLVWDTSLTFVNFVTPKRKIGHVVPEGHPGAGGKWPEFIPPKEGDSRCSCPALNAMANHGSWPCFILFLLCLTEAIGILPRGKT